MGLFGFWGFPRSSISRVITPDRCAFCDHDHLLDSRTSATAYLQDLLRDTREDLALADSKAGLMLASSGVAVGALLAGLLGGTWTPVDLDARVQWIWWIGECSVAGGILSVATAVYPRARRRQLASPEFPTYYGDIARLDSVEALRTAIGATPDLELRLLDQVFVLARTVQTKYTLLRRGLWLFLLALIACTSAVLIDLPLSR